MKKIVNISAIILAASLLAGCSLEPTSSSNHESSVTADSGSEDQVNPQYIGLIYPSFAGEFLSQQSVMVKTELEERGCKVEVVASDNDSAKELQQLENFASMGVDTIMVFPIGATAGEVGNTLQKLRNQGIRVAVIGSQVELGTFDIMMLINQEDVGKKTAQMASDWIDKTFPEETVVEAALITTSTSADSKTASDALFEIENLNTKVKVVETYEHPFGEQITKVQDSIDIMLSKHPDIKVILTYNDVQALAVNETIMSKDNIDKSRFAVFGNGMSQVIGETIKKSQDNSSVLRGTNIYGGAEDVVDSILGNVEVNSDNIYFGEITSVTSDNIEEFLE